MSTRSYEACGFGFGLQRELTALGASCPVIAPCKLDERGERVKTDGRDATALCQRLSRYVEGDLRELAVIRVPSEEEEAARAVHRQREALVRARTKLQAQGRALLINHSQPAPAKWWRNAGWKALEAHVPAWLRERLAVLARGTKATRAARKKAIVAVARQLAVDLWRLNTGRCSAEQLGLHC